MGRTLCMTNMRSLKFVRFNSTMAPKAKLEEFYQYHVTKVALRPWIYRPKNSNLLLTMDLKDPETNKPLQPRDPVKPLARRVLRDYIDSLSGPNNGELLQWLSKWTSVSNRKKPLWNYISKEHIADMLVASFFKLGSYSHLVGTLYNKHRDFIKAGNSELFDVENYFNTWVMCNIHRNAIRGYKDPVVAEKKLLNAWRKIRNHNSSTFLVGPLVDILSNQQGFKTTIVKDKYAEGTLALPKLEDVEEASSRKYLDTNRNMYLMARTISEFSQASLSELESFIATYQQLQNKLGQKDIYDELKISMNEIWKQKESEESPAADADAEGETVVEEQTKIN